MLPQQSEGRYGKFCKTLTNTLMSLWNTSVETSSSSRVPFPPHSLGKGNHIEESYGFCYGISPSQLLAFVSVASLQMWPGANASLQWVLHEHAALGVSVAVFEALSTAPHNAHPKLLTQVHPENLLQGMIGTVTYWGILCLVKHTWNVLSLFHRQNNFLFSLKKTAISVLVVESWLLPRVFLF